MNTKLPWIVGAVALIVCAILFNIVEGPSRCNSGWQSPSIGKKGACSHHGGVAGRWSIVLAIASGAGSGFLTRHVQRSIAERREDKARKATADAHAAAVPAEIVTIATRSKTADTMQYGAYCGKCGGGMRAINITVGPPPYGDFWECLNPTCKAMARRDS